MSLREATAENHKNAEKQPFVGIMFGGKLPDEVYAIYLWNLYLQYETLETFADENGVINTDELAELYRAPKIKEDFKELWHRPTNPPTLQVTLDFKKHLQEISKDPKALLAHCYTRHMGDLSGGQMLKVRVPGSARMYEFQNTDELKAKIREKLSDDLVDEVKIAYDFATKMFAEMLMYLPPELHKPADAPPVNKANSERPADGEVSWEEDEE